MRAETFAIYVAARDRLESRMMAASRALDAVPGIGSGAMGLTPDAVRALPAYRAAKAEYDAAHDMLRRLNAANVKRFGKELRAERDAKRTAALSRSPDAAPIPLTHTA